MNMRSFLQHLNEVSGIVSGVLATSLSANSPPNDYKIQKGDTLSAIAQRNNMSVDQLLKINPNIKDPNKIFIGQSLTLSGQPSPQPQTTTKPQPTTKPQSTPKSTSSDWRQLIGTAEGIRTNAYWDSRGRVWTIGKGSTTHPDGTPVKKGDVISPKQADQYMEHFVTSRVIPTYEKKIPNWSKMNPNQQNALISFGYNVGENFYGAPGFETITTALSSEQNWGDVPGALALYNKAKDPEDPSGKRKVVLPGLVTRRKNEGTVWSSPVN